MVMFAFDTVIIHPGNLRIGELFGHQFFNPFCSEILLCKIKEEAMLDNIAFLCEVVLPKLFILSPCLIISLYFGLHRLGFLI